MTWLMVKETGRRGESNVTDHYRPNQGVPANLHCAHAKTIDGTSKVEPPLVMKEDLGNVKFIFIP